MEPLQAEVGGVGVGPRTPLRGRHNPSHVTEGNRLAPSSACLDSERPDHEGLGWAEIARVHLQQPEPDSKQRRLEGVSTKNADIPPDGPESVVRLRCK